MNFDPIIERIMVWKGFENEKEVAQLFGLSGPDFSNRKKRGSVLPFIVEWALNENVDLNWLLRGKTEEGGETQDLITSKINLILPEMDEAGRRDVLKYAQEKKQLKELLSQNRDKEAA